MICRVCGRQSRGPGILRGDLEIMFCSAAHRDLFEMTDGCSDLTQLEAIAVQATLGPMGEYVGSIGMDRALKDYSKEEALNLIKVVLLNFQRNLRIAAGEGPRADFLDDEIPF